MNFEAALAMVGAFVDLGVSNFDVSVLSHLVGTDGHVDDVKVPDRQLANAHYREVRFRIGKILPEAEDRHWSVILRPRPVSGLLVVQLDDFRRDAIEAIEPFSFLVIETSSENFQAWVAVREPSKQKDLSAFCSGLRRSVGADPWASGAGRLAGSRNFKPKYTPNFPLVGIERLRGNRIVACEDLEGAGLIAPAAPRTIEAFCAVSRSQGKHGWPDYADALRGAPLRSDGSGKDRSKADCMWCKWAAERGYSEGEIAGKLIEVSEKAREEVARGNKNYAIEKARWGVKTAGGR